MEVLPLVRIGSDLLRSTLQFLALVGLFCALGFLHEDPEGQNR